MKRGTSTTGPGPGIVQLNAFLLHLHSFCIAYDCTRGPAVRLTPPSVRLYGQFVVDTH